MPKFSQASFSKLTTCHLDLQVIFFDQELAYKNGATQLHWPHGKHNKTPSMAVDVSPYPVDWLNLHRFYWFGGYVMGIAQKLKEEGRIAHSLRFGGDWNRDRNIDNETFLDLVHFELVE